MNLVYRTLVLFDVAFQISTMFLALLNLSCCINFPAFDNYDVPCWPNKQGSRLISQRQKCVPRGINLEPCLFGQLGTITFHYLQPTHTVYFMRDKP